MFSAQFGCLSWSKCENKLLYVAEKRKNVTADAHNKESACGKVTHMQTHHNTQNNFTRNYTEGRSERYIQDILDMVI